MGLSVIPTNIGGVNIPLAQLQGPLSKLFQDQSSQNLTFPADLASNPAMGHAVMFSIFDYKSGFTEDVGKVVDQGSAALKKVVGGESLSIPLNLTTESAANFLKNDALPEAAKLLQAKNYERQTKGKALANISLFMPDTLNVTYNSNYTDISMTEVMGIKGFIGNAYQDLVKNNDKSGLDMINAVGRSEYAKDIASRVADTINQDTLGGKGLGEVIRQSAGVFTNPQTQLLYKGIDLRQFQLEFIFTPKSPQEAQMVNDICDTFAFYSAPGVAGAAEGNSGQYLTPPQIFQIKFKFLNKTGILGSVANVFTSALSNIGLGFLTNLNPTGTIENAAAAKIMTINDCALKNVNIDYAPNGWAAYNDGYPIQTRLTLQFSEMQIVTKKNIKNPRVNSNFVTQQALNSVPNPTGSDAPNNGWGEG